MTYGGSSRRACASASALLLAAATSSVQAKTYACAPVGVATFPNRVHVRCSVPDNGIAYFAVATADQNAAARFVAISMGASIAARLVVVSYDPADLSGSSIGCSNLDCRLAQWIEMQGP